MSEKYLTVTALTRYIKRKIDTDNHLRDVWLMGEISNFKHHNRGHMYLTIKDDQTRIQAVMFAGKNRFLKFIPENGMKVLIRGDISVFEAFGQYQLYIHQMEPDGVGALFLAYEQLKEKLSKQGYFDQEAKQKIPTFPKHIGIITSPTGAAVRDIIITIKRRYPIVQTTILPVLVQGDNAASTIVDAIKKANQMGVFDLLIVGRGGGSIEELWSFNEETVAEAIFQSHIPIISAVGHETDNTISDYVADLRAPTPTGAGEIAVPSQQELLDRLVVIQQRLSKTIEHKLYFQTKTLKRLNQSYAFRYPEQLLRQKELELDKSMERLTRVTDAQFKIRKDQFDNVFKRFVSQPPYKQLNEAKLLLKEVMVQHDKAFNQAVEKKRLSLSTAIEKLSILNPLEVMKRGFAIPYTSNKELIKSKNQVLKNDLIKVKLADGLLDCQVLKVEE